MRKGGNNLILYSKLERYSLMFNSKYDYAFRKGVVDTLLAIGMNINVVEDRIEKMLISEERTI